MAKVSYFYYLRYQTSSSRHPLGPYNLIVFKKTRGLEFSQQLFEFGLVHKSVYYKIKNKTKQNKNIRRKSSGIFFFYEMFRYLSTMRLQKIEAELF